MTFSPRLLPRNRGATIFNEMRDARDNSLWRKPQRWVISRTYTSLRCPASSFSMRFLLVLAIGAGLLEAGVIQGISVENATRLPLARTRVKLQRVGGSGLTTVQNAIGGRMGQFTFTGLPEGLYVVSAVRAAYAETVFVAKPGDSRTSLVNIGRDTDFFAEVRVRRLGVITGRILDENGIGIPGVNVLAYTASIPLRVTAQGKSDDRGAYRIFGLPKGKYYVRNAPQQLDDGPGLLPTFFPHGTMSRDARAVDVELDRETPDVDITPAHGTLLSISGSVQCPSGAATVVLSSDTGRREARVGCGGSYHFRELAPAQYELLGQQPERTLASWLPFTADQSRQITLDLKPYPSVANGGRGPVTIRRKDPAGEHEPIALALGAAVPILPGMWEMTATPPPGQYLDRLFIDPEWSRQVRGGGDWYEFQARDAARLRIGMHLGERSASLVGSVVQRGERAPGVPVFLYPVLPETRLRAAGNRLTFADDKGNYRFEGLPPGRYLVAASFEISTPTEDAMRLARAEDLTLGDGATEQRTLTLEASQ
jgi:hypothetical protein